MSYVEDGWLLVSPKDMDPIEGARRSHNRNPYTEPFVYAKHGRTILKF